uniref:Uncharacterized protein n=1 Tax=Arundo donax TaxID=35708 RepID=A0A0A9FBA2_ARUDO
MDATTSPLHLSTRNAILLYVYETWLGLNEAQACCL